MVSWRSCIAIVMIIILIYVTYTKFSEHEKVVIQEQLEIQQHIIRRRLIDIFMQNVLRTAALRFIANAHVINDQQNVHDSTVVKEIAKKYERLRQMQGALLPSTVDDLFLFMRNDIISHVDILRTDEDKTIIINLLDFVANANATITALQNDPDDMGESERAVWVRVWLRITSDDTKQQSADLWEILLKQLIDMQVGESFVCVTGRVSRLINTFTLIDPDHTLAEVEISAAQLNTSIINRAQAILQEALDADPIMNEEFQSAEIISDATRSFLQIQIDEGLRRDYSDIVDAGALTKLIVEAQQAIV
jgi:hypothetical protein